MLKVVLPGRHVTAHVSAIGRHQRRRRQSGYTYLGLLFVLAVSGVLMARYGEVQVTARQREKERELIFRGGEIRRAIESYARATPTRSEKWPLSMQDLLTDRRHLPNQHHLRRLYLDPFTGSANWVLLPAPGGMPGFSGVRSQSTVKPLQVRPGTNESATSCVCDWSFSAVL